MSTSIVSGKGKLPSAAAGRPSQGRLLLLDDERMILDVLEETLARLGFDVTAAVSAEDALALVAKSSSPFRVAILDLNIPGGPGGLDLVQPLRLASPRVFMVATSGSSTEPPMLDPAAYGFDASLGKPYRLDELRSLLLAAI